MARIGNFLVNCLTIGNVRAARQISELSVRRDGKEFIALHPNGSTGWDDKTKYPVIADLYARQGIRDISFDRGATLSDIRKDLKTLRHFPFYVKEAVPKLKLRVLELGLSEVDEKKELTELDSGIRAAWGIRGLLKSLPIGVAWAIFSSYAKNSISFESAFLIWSGIYYGSYVFATYLFTKGMVQASPFSNQLQRLYGWEPESGS
ncbi:MAG: hypothetical protein NT030_04115 [Candidatus Saganbacteria bacterium]|nr:hypothetical protein [Candidatus Saganbacteria bacterium]